MKDIEQYLRENAPETPEEGQFLIETNARLGAVEGIKKTVDVENRRWRNVLAITLIAGLVLGSLVTAFAMLYPIQPVQPGQTEKSDLVRIIESLKEMRYVLFGFVAFCAAALGALSLIRKREVL